MSAPAQGYVTQEQTSMVKAQPLVNAIHTAGEDKTRWTLCTGHSWSFFTFSRGNLFLPIQERVSRWDPTRTKSLVRTALGPPGLATTTHTEIRESTDAGPDTMITDETRTPVKMSFS